MIQFDHFLLIFVGSKFFN